jgi:hypothetical protein
MKKLNQTFTLLIFFVLIAFNSNAQGTCSEPNLPLIISQTSALEGGNYYQDIILKDGATVSVTDASINLGIGCKIFIGKGCKLKIQNATLSNACDDMWYGIVVENGETKADDGILEMYESTINRAKRGVNLKERIN